MERSSIMKGFGSWAKTNILNELSVTSPLWGVANAFCILATVSSDAAYGILARMKPELATMIDVVASEHFDEIAKAYRESLVEHPLQFKIRTDTKPDGSQVYKTFYFRPENLDKLIAEMKKGEA